MSVMRWLGRSSPQGREDLNMRLTTLRIAGTSIWLALSGCASVSSTVDSVKDKATQLAQVAKVHAQAVYERQQKYLAEHDTLKNFEDATEHSEAEVLKVLHAARKGSSANAPTPESPKAGPARPPQSSGSAPMLASAPMSAEGGMHWPVEAGVISSDYGARWGKLHKGIDIAADVGEPVYAVAEGDVIYAGDGLRGYGNVVIIQHGQRLSSLYAHNSQLRVKQGDHVGQGMLIALIGSTGHSTGPHVHFELRQGDVAVNPRTLLPATTLADATTGVSGSRGMLSTLNARR
ncbi:MAG TPA: M23 family metallopeptidase [Steroidobacteraceae bacterium]|jgi:murein DD-endopeptidase MepM/ murein hydrolase activator NlpD|nr:M23 family metallopeptidase [Steroidobacteraceae bacterium]